MNKIEFKNISYGFEYDLLLDHASLALYPNKLHFLVGESGSGKTTLLKVLSKKILVDEIECNLPQWQNAPSDKLASEMICYQLIDQGFMQNLTVQKNIEETRKAYGSYGIEDELIKIFNFEPLLKKYPTKLSGGQKRVLSIILALMKNLPIVLLDEPTSSLDDATKTLFLNYLKDYAHQGHIVLMATNDEEICHHAEVMIRLEDRQLIQDAYDEKQALNIETKHTNFPYRLKTILHHPLWTRLVQLSLVITISIFLGHSLYSISDGYSFLKELGKMYDTAEDNTAYVYHAALPGSVKTYDPFGLTLDKEIETTLSQSENIHNYYPYYFLPIGNMMFGKLVNGDDILNAPFYLETSTKKKIDMNAEYAPCIEFYSPEQMEGDKIYISQYFLDRNQLTLEDVQDIKLDIAIPVGYEDSAIVNVYSSEIGAVDSSIPTINYLYTLKNFDLHIDSVHSITHYMYANEPTILMPYSYLDQFIDTSIVPANAYMLVLEDGVDADEVREVVFEYDEDLTFMYPPEENLNHMAIQRQWFNGQVLNHVVRFIVCVVLIVLFLIMLESFNVHDYYYLRYSGLPKQKYMQYRLLESGIILALITIGSFIYILLFKEFNLNISIVLMVYGVVLALAYGLYYIFLKLFYKAIKL